MNEAKLLQLANAAMSLHSYADPRFPPSPYYRFLQLVAQTMNSRLSVELGVCGGGGSLHLAIGSQKAVGVDLVWDHEENIKHILENYSNFEFFLGDSVQLAQKTYNHFGKIDILFIDTLHTYEQTMAEYNAYKDFLSNRAVVCLDDLFRPGMQQAWDDMPSPKLRLDFLHIGGSSQDGGFGVVWK